MLLKDVIGGLRHSAVVVALHLVERHVLVTHEFQHAPEVGLFFVTAIKLQFPIARYDDNRRCIGTNVGERGILVDGRLQRANALLTTDVVMGDALSAEGHEGSQRVGINAILSKPLFVETSCAVSAAAQLSPAVDFADLDGNLLISNDLYEGVTVREGKLVLPDRPGLGLKKL